MSKDKRLEAQTRLYRETYSMGTRVEKHVCSQCGHEEDHVHRSGGLIPPALRFISVGAVPAPTCGSCGESMTYLDGTDWNCTDTACPEQGVRVTTGIGGVIRQE